MESAFVVCHALSSGWQSHVVSVSKWILLFGGYSLIRVSRGGSGWWWQTTGRAQLLIMWHWRISGDAHDRHFTYLIRRREIKCVFCSVIAVVAIEPELRPSRGVKFQSVVHTLLSEEKARQEGRGVLLAGWLIVITETNPFLSPRLCLPFWFMAYTWTVFGKSSPFLHQRFSASALCIL